MSTDERKAQLGVTVDATEARQGFNEIKQGARDMAQAVAAEGAKAGKAISSIGEGGQPSSEKVDSATRSMIQSIQRATAAMEAGSKGSARYFETLASQRNLNVDALKPYLSQLEEIAEKQAVAAASARATSAAFEQFGGVFGRMHADTVRFVDGLSGTTKALAGFAVAAVGVGVLESAMFSLIRPMAEVQAQVDKIIVGLKFANGGSAAAGARDLQFLREEASRLGTDLTVATSSFVKLASAARETSLEGRGAREIFLAISEAATVMHLSAGEAEGALMAIGQMISKGTVQSEELRGQLGERLPGAFQIAARAMGVTTAELGKMLEQGQVISSDFLPKFAAQIRKELAGSVEEAANSTAASLGRIDSAWGDLKRTMADSGLGQAAAGQLNILTDAMNNASESIRRAKAEGAGFWGQFGAGAGSALKFLNPTNAFSYSAESLKGMQQQRADYADQLKDTSLDTFQRGQLAYDLMQLDKRIAEAQKRAAEDSKKNPPNLADVMGLGIEAQKAAEAEARTRKYLTDGKNLTKAENRDKDLKEIDDGFKAATAGVEKGSDLYNQAVAAAAARKKKVWDDFNKEGANASASQAQNALSAELAVFAGYAKERQEILKGDEKNLESMRKRGVLTEQDYVTQLYELRDNALVDQIAIAEKEAEIAGGKKQLSARKKYLGDSAKLEAERINNERTYVDTLAELDAKAARAFADASLRSYDSASKETEAIRAKLEASRDEYTTLGATAQQLAEVSRAREYEAAAAKDAKAAIAALIPGREEEAEQLREQAKLLRELADQKVVNGARKDFVENWKKGADEIGRSLTDALMRGFESGKSFGQNLVSTLKNAFQTLVLRPVIQAVMAPATGAGALGYSGQAGASSGYGGGLSNYSSLLGDSMNGWLGSALVGNSVAYGAAVPGLTVGSQQAAMLASQTGDFGLAGLSSTASSAGYAGATGIGSWANGLSNVGGLYTAGAGIVGGLAGGALFGNKGYSSVGGSLGATAGLALGASTAVSGTAIGASLGAWAGPVGALAGMVIGAALGSLIGGGETRYGASYAVDAMGHPSKFAGPSGGDQAASQVTTAIESTYTSLRDIATKLGGSTDALGQFKASYEVSPRKGNSFVAAGFGDGWYPGRADLKGEKDASKVMEAFQLQLQRSLIEGLKQSNLEKPFADYLSQIDAYSLTSADAQAVLSTLDGLKSFSEAIKAMPFKGFADLSATAALGLAKAAGGMDTLVGSLRTYYQAFYSADEQQKLSLEQLTKQFAALGVAMPDTKDGFRALMEGIDLASESGQKLYASLLQIAPAFAQVTDAMSAFGKQVADFQQSLRLGDMSTLTPEQQYAEAKRQYDATSAAALSGDSAAQSQWTQIAQAFLEASRGYFAGGGRYVDDFAMVQGFRPNGSHANGLAWVPQDGYIAELHKGERVLTAAENREYSMPDWSKYGRGESAALVAEIRTLSAQVESLKETVRQVEQAKEAQAEARHAEALAVQSKQARLQQQLVDK